MKTLEAIVKLVIIFLTLFLASCEEKIDLSVHENDTPRLVVEGVITTDTISHVVKLSYTGGFYLDDHTPRVKGAEVVIREGSGREFRMNEAGNGIYSTENDVYGLPGETYTLEIQLNGQQYLATTRMNRITEIDSLSWRWDPFKKSYRILLYGQEPSGKGDHYWWHLYKNTEHVTTRINELMVVSDDFIDGNYISGFEVDNWVSDFDFQQNDTVRVAQYSVGKDAFDFVSRVLNEYNNGQAAMRPPANVPSNVSNGALGFFYAAAVSHKTVVIKED